MIPDTEVLKHAGFQSINALLKKALLKKAQLRYAGHVVRMSDDRLPKRLLCEELSVGKKSTGGQRKRHQDSIKSSLKAFAINNA